MLFTILCLVAGYFLLGPILGIGPVQLKFERASGENNLFFYRLGSVEAFKAENKSRRGVAAHEIIEQWIPWFLLSPASVALGYFVEPIAGIVAMLLGGLMIRLMAGKNFDLFGHSGEIAYMDDPRYTAREHVTMKLYSSENFGNMSLEQIDKATRRMRKFSGIFVKLITLRLKWVKDTPPDLDAPPYTPLLTTK